LDGGTALIFSKWASFLLEFFFGNSAPFFPLLNGGIQVDFISVKPREVIDQMRDLGMSALINFIAA
jgi:hypothetical protein